MKSRTFFGTLEQPLSHRYLNLLSLSLLLSYFMIFLMFKAMTSDHIMENYAESDSETDSASSSDEELSSSGDPLLRLIIINILCNCALLLNKLLQNT